MALEIELTRTLNLDEDLDSVQLERDADQQTNHQRKRMKMLILFDKTIQKFVTLYFHKLIRTKRKVRKKSHSTNYS